MEKYIDMRRRSSRKCTTELGRGCRCVFREFRATKMRSSAWFEDYEKMIKKLDANENIF